MGVGHRRHVIAWHRLPLQPVERVRSHTHRLRCHGAVAAGSVGAAGTAYIRTLRHSGKAMDLTEAPAIGLDGKCRQILVACHSNSIALPAANSEAPAIGLDGIATACAVPARRGDPCIATAASGVVRYRAPRRLSCILGGISSAQKFRP